MPKLSVIVPVYNVGKYLEKCISSILGQEYRDMEIILVDDGATDDCPEIIERFAGMDRRIRTIHKKNGGLVSARKAGIELSNGQYIMCVDADDYLENGYIAEIMEIAESRGADVVTSAADWGIRKQFDTLPCGLYRSSTELEFLFSNMLSSSPFYSSGILPYLWGKVFKKDVIYESQMLVDERISVGEDVACTYPAMLNAKAVVITPICKYHYRQRDDSMVKKDIKLSDEPIEHLALRYRFMKDRFRDLSGGILRSQLEEYAFFTLFFKFPELLFSDDGEEFIPFGVRKGERVVIYGTGQYGKKIEAIFRDTYSF